MAGSASGESRRVAQLRDHVGRREEARIGHVEGRHVAVDERGGGQEPGRVGAGPRVVTLVDQPPARDVAKETDATERRLLVAESRDPCCVGGVRLWSFAADDRPGTARHERVAAGRARDHRRRGVMAADEVDGHPAPRARRCRRRSDVGQEGAIETDGVAELVGPVERAHVEQPGRPCARPLTGDDAGEVVHEQLREHQDVPRAARAIRDRAPRAGRSC